MFESLIDDINQENKDNNNNNYNDSHYWLFLSKFCIEKQNEKRKKSSKSHINNTNENQRLFSNPEEELLEEFSELNFIIDIDNRCGKKKSNTAINWSSEEGVELKTFINVLLIPKSNISKFIIKMKESF
jgi:hypothetical protein